MDQLGSKVLPSFIGTPLEGQLRLKNIISNTGWLFADRALRMGVGLFVGVWVARYLGPEQFGLYSYAIAFVGMFGVLAGLGLESIVVRDIVRDPTSREEVMGTAFVLKLAVGLLTFLLAVATIAWIRPQDSITIGLVMIVAGGVLFQAFDTIDFWFQSQVQSKYTVYARDAAFLLVTGVKIVLILEQAPLIAFAWAMLAEVVVGAIGLVAVYWGTGHLLKEWQVSIQRAKMLLSDSWPLILSGLVIVVYMRIDQVMLGEMKGAEAVGIYSAAVKLSEVWYFIPMAIVSSVFPSIIEAKKLSEKLYYDRIQQLFNLMSVLAYIVAIPMTVLSGWLVVILYGVEYGEAGPVLAIHIWASLFVFLGVARSPWTTNEGLMKFTFASTGIGAIVNVVLNYLLIPRYGTIGAAVATLIAQMVAAYGSNAFYGKTKVIFATQTRAIFMFDFFKK